MQPATQYRKPPQGASSELVLGCQNCLSPNVVRRHAPAGQPEHIYGCRECGQRGTLADFLVVAATAVIVRRRA